MSEHERQHQTDDAAGVRERQRTRAVAAAGCLPPNPPWQRWRRRAVLALAAFTLAALVPVLGVKLLAWKLGPPDFSAANPVSQLVTDRHGRLLRAFTTKNDIWRLPVSLNAVDPRYLAMLFAYEDRHFYEHGGVDYPALARSLWQFLRAGRPVSGASTITMQLARLLDGLQTRSFPAKFIQIARAGQIERRLSKRQILELYLRLAPFGGNLEGVRAASLAYFGKEPERLSLPEAALLVALPQSPETRRPDRYPRMARLTRNRVLDRVAAAGVISPAEARWAKAQPVPTRRVDFPMLAAHLADREVKAQPDKPVIALSIDHDLQRSAEQAVRAQAERLGPKLSAAALIIENKTGAVRAEVGSAGYVDGARLGAIDMTRAVRSPGSALKPFIYGLAFEAGLGVPDTLIEDRPVRFGQYAPKNFDDSFHGTVSLREALQLSLNVPAVKVLAALGPARLAARFRHTGLEVVIPRNLSVALGGVGLRLEELAQLYVALARGGQVAPLRFRAEAKAAKRTASEPGPVLSPVASWYVQDILRGSPPPPGARGGAIAFKTGTSYGYRDAWAAGFDGRYTIAVWVGRPDGTATPGLTGLTAAAPLLFDLFARLGPQRAPFAPPPRGVMTASAEALPPPLRHFREPGDDVAGLPGTPTRALHIAFPPDGVELPLDPAGGKPMPVALKAEGGTLPLTWLINGRPIASRPRHRQTFWQPDGAGFVQLTVIDANGHQDQVRIRLR